MKICRLTETGVERFIQYLDSLKTDHPQEFPQALMLPSEYAVEIGGDTVWLDTLDLNDRLKTAKGLDEMVRNLGLQSAERDKGFWTWCSAYLFDRLCKRSSGRYKPGEVAIWVAEPDNYKRYYRHYLASIWQVYTAHKDIEDQLVVLLNGPVNTPGELWAQIAANQKLITNRSLIGAIFHLFWDKKNNERKRGTGGISPRRLSQVLRQFERTYDFYAMTPDDLVRLLPREFDRFKEFDDQ
ncbi:hypothetical protein OH214_11295 [Idiomarina abyssalis]|uniref:hypothetical protein n=1 Tax=Idiomarina abyssalis TaxID=86102 RepID=UPI0022FFDF3F|nr:hypothetical protein [Idiomarina abyssalis]MDA6067720.1 hypothetical protein [Idiomarina abyssalis]